MKLGHRPLFHFVKESSNRVVGDLLQDGVQTTPIGAHVSEKSGTRMMRIFR